jgi:hypothetical protein
MQAVTSVKQGTITGLRVLWELAQVIIPAVILVNVLDKTGVMPHISHALTPVMAIFGLKGEAALVLVSANLSTVYAGLGIMAALHLSFKEVTILCAMMAMCHGAIPETALVARSGARASVMLGARLGAMVLVGVVLNMVMR